MQRLLAAYAPAVMKTELQEEAPFNNGTDFSDRLQHHSFPLKVKNTFISDDHESEDEGLSLGDAFQRRQVSAPAASANHLPRSFESDLPNTCLNLPSTPLGRITPDGRDMAKAHAEDGGMVGTLHEEMNLQDEADGQTDDDDDEQEGTGEYATLHMAGAQYSAGSIGHPEECMPCTFYCFTRRGCNRGQECRFCHLTHQSKLQLRREVWKRQQREKRKTIRERVAQEALARRTTAMARGQLGNADRQACAAAVTNIVQKFGSSPVANGRPGKATMLSDAIIKAEQGHPYPVFDMPQFSYTPSQATLTLGQSVEIWPKLAEAPLRFQLATPLPLGLSLNPSNGVIQGTPVRATERMMVVVQANLSNNRMMRASVDIDVVDFTRDGYVVGHISEIEPGRLMMLLHQPDVVEDAVGAPNKQFGVSGVPKARKPASNKKSELSRMQEHGSGGGQKSHKFAGNRKVDPPSAQVTQECSNCGHRLQQDARFCSNCGMKRQDDALRSMRGVQHAPPTGFNDNELYQQMVEPSSMFMQRF